jgi:hypothetical protein
MNPIVVLIFLLALWPLVVQSIILTGLAVSLMVQGPRIVHGYGMGSRMANLLWLACAFACIVIAVGTWLVMKHPGSDFPRSMDAHPTAVAGLLMSSRSLFAWVVVTEWLAANVRQQEEAAIAGGEDLEAYLGQLAA